jgi:hypothetical protein
MLEHRPKSLEIYNNTPMPNRWPNLDWLDLNDIVRYAKPAAEHEW